MNVYDQARSLARAIKNSQEFREYKVAAEKVSADLQQKKLLLDYQQKQLEIQRLNMKGQPVPENKMQALHNLHGILAADLVLNAYLSAEYRFGRMMADVQKIIVEDMDICSKK